MVNPNDYLKNCKEHGLKIHDATVMSKIHVNLLAEYIYKNELYVANYLWQSIPDTLKIKYPDLSQLGIVLQFMDQKNWTEVEKALDYHWPVEINDMMFGVKENIHKCAMLLIEEENPSLYSAVLESINGLSLDESNDNIFDNYNCNSFDSTDSPSPPPPPPSPIISNKEQKKKEQQFYQNERISLYLKTRQFVI